VSSLSPLTIAPPTADGAKPASLVVRLPRVAVVGATLLAIGAAVAVLAPMIAPFDPQQTYGEDFGAPSGLHLLGLDYAGHDVLSNLIWGSRQSMYIGFAASLISLAVGGLIGLAGGYFGGPLDKAAAFVTDLFLVIPVLPLMITLASLYGTTQNDLVAIIGLLSWMSTARLVRSQSKSIRERTYIKRTRAAGAGHIRILFHHVLPQVAPLLVATATLAIATAIFFEAALAFLGLGDPTVPSWGNMIAFNFQGGAVIAHAWWAIVPPGAAIAAIVTCASLVGRSLEERLNPRLATSHLSSRTFRVLSTRVGPPPEPRHRTSPRVS
jgi:peptide/nickel transport system permease protein